MPIITAGTTGVQLVPMSAYRTSLNVENRHATASIYIDTMTPDGITVNNAAIKLAPGESAQVTEAEDGERVKEAWAVISDTAATMVAVFEGWRKL